ncbi:MAG: FtsX-like permease family protein [Alphaproteobacteria bacterium]|jgi:putative ABC transport system permease protein|nr:FtsX-like permease family protein [Alphaproteobacteria bacterium]
MVIAPLDRKLLRDLRRLRGQGLAVALVVAAGVAVFVLTLGNLRSLEATQAAYYERYAFADVFARLTRAPNRLGQELSEIPGVAAVETRIGADVILDVPGMVEPARARVLSLPPHGDPALNRLVLRQGRLPDPDRPDEAVIAEAFAEAHGLEPGDGLSAILDGRLERLTIVGIALSPEFIYSIGPGQLVPDDRLYGIVWMGRPALEAAFDLDGAFNDVAIGLTRNASRAAVIDALDQVLAPYGGAGAHGRRDQISHAFIESEMDQLRSMGRTVPLIFLGVAAFLLNVVVGRIVDTEREQIGLLKAFGYTDWAVGRHYLKLVMALVLVGVSIGVGLGAWLGHAVTQLYAEFFRFPFLHWRPSPGVFAVAALVSVAAGALGTLGSVRRAVRLAPAVAMVPAPPMRYGRTILERLGLTRYLTEPSRMILRHLSRRPLRAGLTTLGIAMGGAIMVTSMAMRDATDHLIDVHFNQAQRQDATLIFSETLGSESIHGVGGLPGVLRAEGFRAAAADIAHGGTTRQVAITALDPDSDLYRLLDADLAPVAAPLDGVALSSKLAELLDVRPGDRVRVSIKEGRRAVADVTVQRVVEEYIGLSAYMAPDVLADLLGEGRTVSGAYLAIDPIERDALYASLKQTPVIAGVNLLTEAEASLRATMEENVTTMTVIFVGFAGVIAFGVVYNAARIGLSERGRELASLRVLGFTRAEVSWILLGELGLLTLAALPLGCAVGWGFSWLMMLGFDSELFRIPLVVDRSSYGWSVVVVVMAALVSGAVVRHRIDRLDLIAVLKTRE